MLLRHALSHPLDLVIPIPPWDKPGLDLKDNRDCFESCNEKGKNEQLQNFLASHLRTLLFTSQHSHTLTELTLSISSTFSQARTDTHSHTHICRPSSLLSHAHSHTSRIKQHSSTMSTQRSQSQQPQPASPASYRVNSRLRADSDSIRTIVPPAYAPSSTPTARHHLPFSFGAEIELIIRPKEGPVPEFDASTRELRDFNNTMLKQIADLLSNAGMPANAYDPCEDDKPDYTRWNVMLDGSLSKKHTRDGFCERKLRPC